MTCIDCTALSAELETASARINELERKLGFQRTLHQGYQESANDRAEAAEARVESNNAKWDKLSEETMAALRAKGSEVAALHAELTEVRDAYSRLASALWAVDTYAPQLLTGSGQFGGMVSVEGGAWLRAQDVRAFLAANTESPRAPAERAVLDNCPRCGGDAFECRGGVVGAECSRPDAPERALREVKS